LQKLAFVVMPSKIPRFLFKNPIVFVTGEKKEEKEMGIPE